MKESECLIFICINQNDIIMDIDQIHVLVYM